VLQLCYVLKMTKAQLVYQACQSEATLCLVSLRHEMEIVERLHQRQTEDVAKKETKARYRGLETAEKIVCDLARRLAKFDPTSPEGALDLGAS
jgi:hypothetical protein